MLDHEHKDMMWECHVGIGVGHVGEESTTDNVLHVVLWWPTIFKDAKSYAHACEVCQWVGKPSQ